MSATPLMLGIIAIGVGTATVALLDIARTLRDIKDIITDHVYPDEPSKHGRW